MKPRPVRWEQKTLEIGGKTHRFKSRWEANYARYLEWLKGKGLIREWEYERETFWFLKIKRGVRSYTPDFRVTEAGGRQVYHEVKGWMDPRSATILKRMRIYHPAVPLLLIDAKAFRAIARDVHRLVPGWDNGD